MAKFTYRMQNVLDVKYKLEEQAKTNYANARMALNKEEEKLAELQKRRDDYNANYKSQMEKASISVRELRESVDFLERMKNIIRAQLIQVNVAEKNLETARIRLQSVMQDRKTHEKLKEHAFEEFVKELNVQETKETDELVSFKYSKKIK